MDYKTLKILMETLRNNGDEKIEIEKDVIISIIEEVLLLRRRNTAKVRQRMVTKTNK